MQRFVSLVCVGFLLLNVMGYYGLFLGMQYHNDREMSNMIDADHYDETNSISIKVPLTIPYVGDQQKFERVHGKFNYQGNIYRLVKQKYAQDTLTIVCVADVKSEEINQALEEYVKTFSDKPMSSKNGKISITLIKDYLPQASVVTMGSSGWATNMTLKFTSIIYKDFNFSISTPPPRSIV